LTDVTHNRSLVVWDVPSAIARGESFAIKAGLKCEAECLPENWALEVRNHEGSAIANAVIGDQPWPDTAALYAAEIELVAPDSEGQFGWEVVAPVVKDEQAVAAGQAAAAGDGAGHAEASARFNLSVVPAAECLLTVVAIDRESQQPVSGLKVVIHPYRAVTDERGVAELNLPKGQYRVFVSGQHFFPFRVDGELTSDQTIRAELDVDRGPSDAEMWS